MAPSYKLHAPAGSFRAFAPLIAAEYNDVTVEVATDSTQIAALSPTGKAPVLEILPTAPFAKSQVLFSSHAIARYLASLRRDTGLLGQSLTEQAAIDAWMDYTAQDLELPACIWFYPVAGYMPFNQEAYEKAKTDLGVGLEILQKHLQDKTYLVGDQITLADVVVASTLLYPFKLVCDKSYLKPYGNVVRWFQTCVNQPQFKNVVGQVAMCKKELLAEGQAASEGKGGKKAEKKKEKEKDDKKKEAKKEAAPAPPKKTEHPYKIMDKEAPSSFSMDAWKKMYSNAPTYEDSMKYFWEKFDKDGWSLWTQAYNYNEDNKRIFMTSNAVGGFQQRTDEIRRWAFGVMDVLGTEETVLEIKGLWLLRGDTVEHMINANDDANWYTWTKIAGKDMDPTEEVKKQVFDYWCAEEQLEGKPIQDSKVFK